MKILITFLAIVLVLLGVSFALLNAEIVTVNFYLTTLRLPISLLIVLTLLFGILIGFLLLWMKYLKLKYENQRIKRFTNHIDKDVKKSSKQFP